MSKKIVKYIYRGKEHIEKCDKAAERVFKDRSENELVRFNSLKKHSPKGRKRYLADDSKDLYPLGIENRNLIRQIKQVRPGWFMPPHIGPKTLSRIFGLICECSNLEYGKDLIGPEWD